MNQKDEGRSKQSNSLYIKNSVRIPKESFACLKPPLQNIEDEVDEYSKSPIVKNIKIQSKPIFGNSQTKNILMQVSSLSKSKLMNIYNNRSYIL